MSGPSWKCFELKDGMASAMFSNSKAIFRVGDSGGGVAEVSPMDCDQLIVLLTNIRDTLIAGELEGVDRGG